MPENLTLTAIHSSHDIPDEQWLSLAGSGNPFVHPAFFKALETSRSVGEAAGWVPLHFALYENKDTLVGLLPGFLKKHSMGEYVFDHGWAQSFERAGGHYYPKYVTAIPFTPASAPKLWLKDRAHAPLLLEAVKGVLSEKGISGHHATFLNDDDASTFLEVGYLPRHDIQYHWHNRAYKHFEDFLSHLTSRKRKVIQRERREALKGGLSIKWLTGSDLSEEILDAYYTFYLNTSEHKWGHAYLTRSFFSLLAENLADKMLLVMAFRGEKPIAGALNFIGKDTLFGRNWGACEFHEFLHFECCYYQAIEYAIQHGLKRVEAGAQGEHKIARGYAPVKTTSAHWLSHNGFHAGVEQFLSDERPEIVRIMKMLEEKSPYKSTE